MPGPVFVTERSAFCNTVPVTVDVLFVELGSGVAVELALAMFVIVPLALDASEYVAVTLTTPFAAMFPSEHGNVVHPPPLTEASVSPGGVGSLNETAAASEGPAFFTSIV